MGIFYSVRGWLELSPEQLELVKQVINLNQDQNPYLESWVFSKRGGGFSRFVFFGHTVNQASLHKVRSQIERIATTIQTQDGHITDYVDGEFKITAEDRRSETTWLCRDGKFTEI